MFKFASCWFPLKNGHLTTKVTHTALRYFSEVSNWLSNTSTINLLIFRGSQTKNEINLHYLLFPMSSSCSSLVLTQVPIYLDPLSFPSRWTQYENLCSLIEIPSLLSSLFLKLKNHSLLKQQQQKKNPQVAVCFHSLGCHFCQCFFLMLLDFFLIIFNFLRRESLVDHRIHRWKSTNQINAAEFQRNLLIQHLFEMGLAR